MHSNQTTLDYFVHEYIQKEKEDICRRFVLASEGHFKWLYTL